MSIWEHFAVKRRQFYLAGFFIGAFGADFFADTANVKNSQAPNDGGHEGGTPN
jgi:hypothetical protein